MTSNTEIIHDVPERIVNQKRIEACAEYFGHDYIACGSHSSAWGSRETVTTVDTSSRPSIPAARLTGLSRQETSLLSG